MNNRLGASLQQPDREGGLTRMAISMAISISIAISIPIAISILSAS
jgi:hypothetical protein